MDPLNINDLFGENDIIEAAMPSEAATEEFNLGESLDDLTSLSPIIPEAIAPTTSAIAVTPVVKTEESKPKRKSRKTLANKPKKYESLEDTPEVRRAKNAKRTRDNNKKLRENLATENATLKAENSGLKQKIESLEARVAQLTNTLFQEQFLINGIQTLLSNRPSASQLNWKPRLALNLSEDHQVGIHFHVKLKNAMQLLA